MILRYFLKGEYFKPQHMAWLAYLRFMIPGCCSVCNACNWTMSTRTVRKLDTLFRKCTGLCVQHLKHIMTFRFTSFSIRHL